MKKQVTSAHIPGPGPIPPRTPLQRKRAFLLLMLQLVFLGAYAQVTVRGTIKNAAGEVLPGVTVRLNGSAAGSTSDNAGKYSIHVPADTCTLLFSYVGYETQAVQLAGRQTVNVVLKDNATGLQGVVVIGYGTQSNQTITTAVSKLDMNVLKNVPLGSAGSALQGTIPGVRVQTASGQPGATPRIIIRGGTSINNPDGATPLYIVDGVIRQDLAGVNPADIESMQVLKDAASTAIYGSRASNGVVIITTKKGKAGTIAINYRYTMGFSKVPFKYGVLNAHDYIYYNRLGLAATGEKHPERLAQLNSATGFGTGNDLSNKTAFTTQFLTPENAHKLDEGWQSMPDPLDPAKTIIYDGVDWQDVIYRTGLTNDHYLNLSGGSEKATFALGLGYTNMRGIAINTGFKRYTANLSGKLQLRKNIAVFAGLNFSRTNNETVYDEAQIFNRSLASPPTQKYYYEDSSLAPGYGMSLGNPEYYLGRQDNQNSFNNITLNGGLTWELLPGLTFEPSASLLLKTGDTSSFMRSFYNGPGQYVNSRNATGTYTKWDQQQVDAVLRYNKTFGSVHNFQAVAGASYFNRESSGLSAAGTGAATDLIPTLNASAQPVSVSSVFSKQVIAGYFARVIYDYDRKYLFTLSTRYDGASNLGDENKWGWFPGVSAGWNVHQENFWHKPLQVNRLKLRASYGVTGNLGNLTDYQAQGQYSVGPKYQGVAAVEYTGLANQALRWEQSQTFDLGFDAGAFDDRLYLSFDYYRRETKNLLTSLPLPYSTGFTSILTNYGSLENKGIEIELGATVLKSNDFSWQVSANVSRVANKILRLPENGNKHNRIGGYYVYDPRAKAYDYLGGLQEGSSLGDLYGYEALSIYATDKEAQEGPLDILVVGKDKTKGGGDVNWRDLDRNDTIDTRDMSYMGNIFPKWTGGFSSTLAYKGLSLYVRLDYATGHTIYNYMRASLDGQFVGVTNSTTDILRSWLKEGDQTNVPRYYWADQVAQANYWRGDPRSGQQGASFNYEKGDYLALREITLSYTLPANWYKRAGISDLRFYATGSNLKYFTAYKGYSPEQGGLDGGRYPIPRSIMFGLNLSF